MFEVLFFAGAGVVAEGFAFVEELDAAGITGAGCFGGDFAEVTDSEPAFCYVVGWEMKRIGGPFVFHYQDVGIQCWFCLAGTREIIAVATIGTVPILRVVVVLI